MKSLPVLFLSLFLGACTIFGGGKNGGNSVAYYVANDDARTQMLVQCATEPERRWSDPNCEFAEAARSEVQQQIARQKSIPQ